jgi:hypothetical protein
MWKSRASPRSNRREKRVSASAEDDDSLALDADEVLPLQSLQHVTGHLS